MSVCHCSDLQSVVFLLFCRDEAVDLAELGAVELGQVLGNGDQILVHHRVELGEGVIVARLLRLLHLRQVVFHGVELSLVHLSEEGCNLGEHGVLILSFNTGLCQHVSLSLILIIPPVHLGQRGGDLLDVFDFALSQELRHGREVMVVLILRNCLNLGQDLLIVIGALYLGHNVIHGAHLFRIKMVDN